MNESEEKDSNQGTLAS